MQISVWIQGLQLCLVGVISCQNVFVRFYNQLALTVCVFCLMLFNMAALKKTQHVSDFLENGCTERVCVFWQQGSNVCAFVFDPTLDCVVLWCISSACSVSAFLAACCDVWVDVKCARVPAIIAS